MNNEPSIFNTSLLSISTLSQIKRFFCKLNKCAVILERNRKLLPKFCISQYLILNAWSVAIFPCNTDHRHSVRTWRKRGNATISVARVSGPQKSAKSWLGGASVEAEVAVHSLLDEMGSLRLRHFRFDQH